VQSGEYQKKHESAAPRRATSTIPIKFDVHIVAKSTSKKDTDITGRQHPKDSDKSHVQAGKLVVKDNKH